MDLLKKIFYLFDSYGNFIFIIISIYSIIFYIFLFYNIKNNKDKEENII